MFSLKFEKFDSNFIRRIISNLCHCIITLHRRYLVRIHIQEINSYFVFVREEKCTRAPAPVPPVPQVKPIIPAPPIPKASPIPNVTPVPEAPKMPAPVKVTSTCSIPTAASANSTAADNPGDKKSADK